MSLCLYHPMLAVGNDPMIGNIVAHKYSDLVGGIMRGVNMILVNRK